MEKLGPIHLCSVLLTENKSYIKKTAIEKIDKTVHYIFSAMTINACLMIHYRAFLQRDKVNNEDAIVNIFLFIICQHANP